jgi:hypothetical protein
LGSFVSSKVIDSMEIPEVDRCRERHSSQPSRNSRTKVATRIRQRVTDPPTNPAEFNGLSTSSMEPAKLGCKSVIPLSI